MNEHKPITEEELKYYNDHADNLTIAQASQLVAEVRSQRKALDQQEEVLNRRFKEHLELKVLYQKLEEQRALPVGQQCVICGGPAIKQGKGGQWLCPGYCEPENERLQDEVLELEKERDEFAQAIIDVNTRHGFRLDDGSHGNITIVNKAREILKDKKDE